MHRAGVQPSAIRFRVFISTFRWEEKLFMNLIIIILKFNRIDFDCILSFKNNNHAEVDERVTRIYVPNNIISISIVVCAIVENKQIF